MRWPFGGGAGKGLGIDFLVDSLEGQEKAHLSVLLDDGTDPLRAYFCTDKLAIFAETQTGQWGFGGPPAREIGEGGGAFLIGYPAPEAGSFVLAEARQIYLFLFLRLKFPKKWKNHPPFKTPFTAGTRVESRRMPTIEKNFCKQTPHPEAEDSFDICFGFDERVFGRIRQLKTE
ncbi:MAG: hypothetical protein CM15mP80_00620 [Alphaproteobacteria bacterium]|nr:MAG: hypothetical protein CM15mP80_00620 [Alphaproteobacteria bacterium]